MTAISNPTHVPNPDDASLPAMIRVLATIGFILAAIGLVSSPFLLLRLTGSASDAELPLRAPEARWLIITALSGGGLSGLLLIASTGKLFQGRESLAGFGCEKSRGNSQ